MSEKEKDDSLNELLLTAGLEIVRLKDSNHSLRMAVLEFMNEQDYSPSKNKNITYVEENLALSAGIEFVNGTWILKEGEL